MRKLIVAVVVLLSACGRDQLIEPADAGALDGGAAPTDAGVHDAGTCSLEGQPCAGPEGCCNRRHTCFSNGCYY